MSDPDEFERRARALLRDSADALSGQVRSRLTQARHAALASSTARSPWRGWLPAGVAAAAVLAMLVTLQPRSLPDGPRMLAVESGAGLEDVDLLADSEAFDLAQERDIAQGQDMGADFYEWAVDEADGSSSLLGT